MNNLAYRRDIDGLRCLAVLAVMFYHLDFPFTSGGFVGVDIFLVISGYLITGKLRADSGGGLAALLRFYMGRIRRLAPAYVLVAIFTTLISVYLLTPLDFEYFSASLVASFVSMSNLFFGNMSGGYFILRLEEMPLLHTWSLSAEEQFYLLWAPIVIFLGRQKILVTLLFFGGAISIWASWYATSHAWPSAYFLLQYRAFELILGGFLALMVERGFVIHWRPLAEAAGLTGLCLILATIILFKKTDPFPGLMALLPAMGATLVIASGSKSQSLVMKFLSLKPFVGIGVISYSLYLWHWPLIVFLRYAQVSHESIVWWLVGPVATLIAWLSWKYVEMPIRKHHMLKNTTVLRYLLVAPVLLSFVLFAAAQLTGGLPQRFSNELRPLISSYSQEFDFTKSCSWSPTTIGTISLEEMESKCHLGPPGIPTSFLMLGDSHASHFKPFIDELAYGQSIGGVYHVQGGCSPVEGITLPSPLQTSREACYERNRQLFSMASKFNEIVLAARWSAAATSPSFENDLDTLVTNIIASGARPILIQEVPHSEQNLSRCALYVLRGWTSPEVDCRIKLVDVEAVGAKARLVIERVRNRHPTMHVLDVRPLICDGQGCVTTIDGLALYRDSDHINAKASTALGQNFLKHFVSPFQSVHDSQSPAE